jgi:hypothetical protein
MIGGAIAISFAEAPESEQDSWQQAVDRECDRYGLEHARVAAAVRGDDPLSAGEPKRHWWEIVVLICAVAVFVWLAVGAERPAIALNIGWMALLLAATLVSLGVSGWMLWKRTRFS